MFSDFVFCQGTSLYKHNLQALGRGSTNGGHTSKKTFIRAEKASKFKAPGEYLLEAFKTC